MARNGKKANQPVLPAEEFQPTATELLIRPFAEEYASLRDKRIGLQAEETAAYKRLQ